MSVTDLVRAERLALANLLADLTPEQWSHPTLCSQWRVRDLAAHVISYDDLSFAQIAKRRVVDARGSMDRFNAIAIDDYASFTTAELVDIIRERAQPRGYMAAFGGTIGLLDAMIHQQDIRRPLGIARVIPPERLRVALQRSLYVPILCSAWRGRGLRLIATDVDWTHGSGLEVQAPGEALLMSLAGRDAAFGELSGPGTSTLVSRLRVGKSERAISHRCRK
ncbi:maleylpyruvate isomerase family mycothiol-dependent enzyme [Mycolicibacterium baixiangningiae]|uniref:maleylpyruvate isomerase family mycothiol-dependent enzyme n=1 Tax=Mycolicibacterium baixiangningiae TaxID=2761578 RepID=UPI003558492E